jgi:hypothetical protein
METAMETENTELEQVQDETHVETPVESEATETVTEPEESPVLAGMTESQIKTLLSKAAMFDEFEQSNKQRFDQVFGKIGELNRSLQQKPSAPSEATVNRLKQIWDEDSVSALIDALSESRGGVDQAHIEQLIQDRTAEIEARTRQAMEERFMYQLDPEWNTKRASPEYRLWLGTLQPEDADKVVNAANAIEFAGHLKRFDAWKDAGVKRQQNKDRLAKAVTVQGAPSVTSPKPTSEDAFIAGFKAVRGG